MNRPAPVNTRTDSNGAAREDDFERVTLRGVRKVFGRHVALAGVDAELTRGQLSLLMGPNGAGKSTLLSILSTLAPPTGGELHYGELAFADARWALRHRIGLVAHAALLYRELTVRENLQFFASLYALDDPNAAVERQLEQMSLAEVAHRPVLHLSRGWTQRVSLARALLPRPKLLLLDEPFTGLDREAIDMLRVCLADARDQGTIQVIVSHDVDSVDGLCDQLLVLAGGRIALCRAERGLSAEALRAHYREVAS